ncbi:DNA repair and recombination protein RadB [Candidatus Woesearchaeota archaeon]|nr:DNA repair and recombination protein RadB [Candidatus Woesearchaeota archaeon]
MTKISTGIKFLDAFLDGGYDAEVVTTIYGPSGSGKTNLCLLAAVHTTHTGKKVLFVDTEGGIAVERIKQLSKNYEKVLQRIMFFNPTTFAEQDQFLSKLKNLINDKVGLIVVDSVSMLYRVELGKHEETQEVNAALGRQLAALVGLARKKHIPVLVTNQVYADFNQQEQVKMVGGDLLKYSSKCLMELQKLGDRQVRNLVPTRSIHSEQNGVTELANCRGLVLRKHRSLPEGKMLRFKIVQEGIEEVK